MGILRHLTAPQNDSYFFILVPLGYLTGDAVGRGLAPMEFFYYYLLKVSDKWKKR